MLDGSQWPWPERRGDAGEVQHVGVRDGGVVDVRGGQPGRRAAGAVVTNPPGLPAAVFLDHHSGRCRAVLPGDHLDTLAADFSGDQGTEGVVTDPTDPGRCNTEPGQPDGDVGFRAADANRKTRPAAELTAAGCGQQGHSFPEGHHRSRRSVRGSEGAGHGDHRILWETTELGVRTIESGERLPAESSAGRRQRYFVECWSAATSRECGSAAISREDSATLCVRSSSASVRPGRASPLTASVRICRSRLTVSGTVRATRKLTTMVSTM